MVAKVILVVGAIFLLLALPEKFWKKLQSLGQLVSEKFKYWQTLSPIYRGKLLQKVISEGMDVSLVKREEGFKEIPYYKFYTSLFLLLLKYNRSYGAPLRRPLLSLQGRLSDDLKFEQKLVSSRRGTVAEFILITAIVWAFTFIVESVLSLPRNFSIDLLIIAIQGSGFFCFFALDKIIRKINLGWFEKSVHSLYSFDSLLEVGLSSAEVISLSKIGTALSVFEDKLPGEHIRLEQILKKWQKQGLPIKVELDGFLQDIWNKVHEKFEVYTKQLQVVKFLILALFFLSSYFIYLTSLFDRLFS